MNNYKVALAAMPLAGGNLPSIALASLAAFLKKKNKEKNKAKNITVSVHGFSSIFDGKILTDFLNKLYRNPRTFQEAWQNTDSFLKKKEYKKAAVFLDLMLKYCLKDVLKEEPRMVGLSVISSNLAASLFLARLIKKTNPEITIIFGGPETHYNKNGGFILDTGFADAIVIGEGEAALYELVEKYRSGASGSVPGAVTAADAKSLHTLDYREPLDMELLPFPDFSGFKFKDDREKIFTIAFNRGCTGRCTYCFERSYWGRFRQMSAGRAVATLEHLMETYGVKEFNLSQSLMNADIKWLSKFCDLIIEKGLSPSWTGNARVHPQMDGPFMEKLAAAGCRSLWLGLESGSDNVLRDMGKGITVSQSREFIKAAYRSGIIVHAYWIIGYPTETREDLVKTLDFIIENSDYINGHSVYRFNLLRGSGLYPGEPRSKKDVEHFVPGDYCGEGTFYKGARHYSELKACISDCIKENKKIVQKLLKRLDKLDCHREHYTRDFLDAIVSFKQALASGRSTSIKIVNEKK
ncbi:MAG: B12-binding domain-containing radical SAM protein [bacterium]|nr:B12-binding domain-containing radical SAM protein [bacterium]